jgi:hypothetical protein
MSNSLSDIESVTIRVVDHYTEQGFLFTALDISNTVKKSLPGVRHREVAAIVRALYDDGKLGDEYTRSNIDVTADGKTVTAFLYHLDEDDPDDYAGTQRQQQPIPPVAVTLAGPVTGAPATQVALELGKDNRARLPLDFVRGAGLNAVQVVVGLEGAGPALRLTDPGHTPGSSVLATLPILHPSVLHLPTSLLSAFDLTQPVMAYARAGAIVLEGIAL